jgi:hypothetical protein
MNKRQLLERQFIVWDKRDKNHFALSTIRNKLQGLLWEIIEKRKVSKTDVRRFAGLKQQEKKCYHQRRAILDEDNRVSHEFHKLT